MRIADDIAVEPNRSVNLSVALWSADEMYRFTESSSVRVLAVDNDVLPIVLAVHPAGGPMGGNTTVFVEALYSVTQVVNPLLPISLIAGRSVALGRLGRGGVACVEPQRIPICGKVKLVCFDKTGTPAG